MRLIVSMLSLALPLVVGGQVCAAGPDFFSTQVRPILAGHCFKCHGPDDKARKAKLRLDNRDGTLRKARSGNMVIEPGKPEKSELLLRIFAKDAGEVMPPAHTKNPLTDREKEILKRWVAQGGEYTTHWAFAPPRQVLPKVRRTGWSRNAIDDFILARLEAEGLAPSPEADRYTLVRRLYFDLVGLPPTPREAEEFVNDPAPDAYEKLVDRLLASPHYGERWARRWLDLARYADTNGYEKDRQRSVWPYRDWVIGALNADLPFDRFTIDQLAGDLLPGAKLEQRVATGFHRNTMLNEEGGIDPLEFRFYALTDRVATTATAWLGLTLGCAQCHTHKYDPISQREYYQFMAFLNNTDEPEIELPSAEVARGRAQLEAKIAALEADLPNQFPPREEKKADGPAEKKGTKPAGEKKKGDRPLAERRREHLERSFNVWLAREAARTARWTVLRPVSAKANLALLTVLDDGSVLASGDQTKSDTYDLRFHTDLRGITAVRLEALPDDRLPKHGPGRIYYEGPFGDFFLSELTLSSGGQKLSFGSATHSFASGPRTAAMAIDGNPQTGWSINGGQGKRHCAVFTLAKPQEDARALEVHMLFEQYYPAGLGRFRISVTTDAVPAVARAIPPEDEELLLTLRDCLKKGPDLSTCAQALTAEQRRRLLPHFLAAAPELEKQRAAIEDLRKQLLQYPTTLVMQERPRNNPRPTFMHNRGEFLQPTERVEPGVLAALFPLPKDAPADRLGFARWLVSPDNPLTARVTVNRQWAAIFGKGIVRTAQDFGYQGEPPSHPELLDWLAVEFIRQGWSMKALHCLIVTSATYRQSSRVTPALLARDPDNRLLARGARVRLEAEQVRDTLLRASGLFSPKIGGPSVFPPQPAGVTTEGTFGGINWSPSAGPDRYRRALYTFTKRTAPYAMLATFDAPSGEVCVARREVTNTPLQALTLLNDLAFNEAAQALGRSLAARPGPTAQRVDCLFRCCLTRPPRADEAALLQRFFETQRCRFEKKELDAAKVAGPGEGNVNERAAWTALARALFNLDEAIVKK